SSGSPTSSSTAPPMPSWPSPTGSGPTSPKTTSSPPSPASSSASGASAWSARRPPSPIHPERAPDVSEASSNVGETPPANAGGTPAPPAKQSNLVVRLTTGFTGAPLILLLLYQGPAWGWLVFVMLAGGVGAYEFFAMTHPEDRLSQVLGVLLTEAV